MFGKLILDDEPPHPPLEGSAGAAAGSSKKDELAGGDGALSEGDVDLKEHMVGILFSRSKLTHLQKQVWAFIFIVSLMNDLGHKLLIIISSFLNIYRFVNVCV